MFGEVANYVEAMHVSAELAQPPPPLLYVIAGRQYVSRTRIRWRSFAPLG